MICNRDIRIAVVRDEKTVGLVVGTRDDHVESGEGIEQCNYAMVVGWLGWGYIEVICVIHSSSSVHISSFVVGEKRA